MAAEAGRPSAPEYAAAGVDVDANTRLIPRLHALGQTATRSEVIGRIGAFSGIFDLSGFTDPLLVASTDSVGTKVLLAGMIDRYDSVGEDLVNHCVNDILTAGARPLFFLDYLGNHGLSEDQKITVVESVARACRRLEVALLGGETADLPGLYAPGAFDLAGTIIGVVEKGRQIDGSTIVPGDVLIGIPSNGLHTNGYSLARSVFELGQGDIERDRLLLAATPPELDVALGEALLRPHRCYWPLLAPVLDQCKGIAHITGGGIAENLRRVLPAGTAARVQRGSWPEPALFALIQRAGEIREVEMWRVFNMGLGLLLVVAADTVAAIQAELEDAYIVGSVRAADAEPTVAVVPADA